MDRWGIIVSAHSYSVRKRWDKIRECLEKKGVAYDSVQSEGDVAVERLSRMLCSNGYKTIVVVGADGSLYDAANGILHMSRGKGTPALGIIPTGIGNDFATFWGIQSDDYDAAIDNIIARRTRRIDVGVCRYTDEDGIAQHRFFLNCINVGLGARLIELTNRWRRLIGSKRLSLLPVLLAQVFERKSYHVNLKADTETIQQEVMSICIGNSTGYGQTPNSVPYNGRLDMSVITRPQWWQLFEGFWLLNRGQFLNYRNVHPYRLVSIQAQDFGRAPVSLDGRLLAGKKYAPMQIDVEKERLDFIISKD